MSRVVTVVILALLSARQADAAAMTHYDLAGLLMQSDTVVIADRIDVVSSNQTRYRVVRSLVGTLAPGDAFEVSDEIYRTSRHSIDARAVLFMTQDDRGERRIVRSGLRVLADGKVWRFEQQSNPGPYEMVPQGRDPQDQWGLGGAQLDLAGLERAIIDAGKRIVALGVARTIADPVKRRAAVLALFPAGAGADGLYTDLLAAEARQLLTATGDLEGALLVDLRDRGGVYRGGPFATAAQLVAIAKDPAKSEELRVAALDVVRRGFALQEDHASLRAIVALIQDPSPSVRAAAITAAADPARSVDSDRVAQRKLDAVMREVAAAIARRYAVESDPRVLAVIAEAYTDNFDRPLPRRTGGPKFAAAPSLSGDDLRIDVYCLKRLGITDSRVILASPAGTIDDGPFSTSEHCNGSTSYSDRRGAQGIPAGTYQIVVEVTPTTGAKLSIPLGLLVVDLAGERQLVP